MHGSDHENIEVGGTIHRLASNDIFYTLQRVHKITLEESQQIDIASAYDYFSYPVVRLTGQWSANGSATKDVEKCLGGTPPPPGSPQRQVHALLAGIHNLQLYNENSPSGYRTVLLNFQPKLSRMPAALTVVAETVEYPCSRANFIPARTSSVPMP